MLYLIRRPLPFDWLAAITGGIVVAVALYCVAYTSLAGRPETFTDSLGWAVANIAPWFVAIELGKRAAGWLASALVLGAALCVSVALGYALSGSNDALSFELVRRLPALAGSAVVLALLRSRVGHVTQKGSKIPLSPNQIDWVRAAGNYVELRAAGRTIVHRLSIAAAERELACHGFVRIHRSTIVRRDRIARVRPQDVVLVDGTHLRIGKRYRADLTV